jgi:CubicO group peptidase (beta-lactamase class C family)
MKLKQKNLLPFLLICPLLAAASGLPHASAEDAGMSREILDAGVGLYRRAVDRNELAGAVLLVARNGKVVLHDAVGWRNLHKTLPMEKDTLFRMASNTKPLIATGVLMLAQEKKLSLEDNVRKYLPSFDNYRGGWIKIKHLLSHTSGLRVRDASGEGVIFLSPLLKKSPEHPDAPSLQAEVSRFGQIGAENPPGTVYSYSDPGYNTLGALIEVVSGKPLEVFLKERIYDPLGMSDTSNHESKSPNERMSAVLKRAKDGTWSAGWKPGDPPDYPFVRASGGTISSADDYLRFCQMFLNGGELDGKRILREETVKAATSPAPNTENLSRGRPNWYGYGWQLFENGVYGHAGSDGTFAWIDPSTKVIGMVLTQTQGGVNPRSQFMKVVDAAIYQSR